MKVPVVSDLVDAVDDEAKPRRDAANVASCGFVFAEVANEFVAHLFGS
jgi:hypothetical protein